MSHVHTGNYDPGRDKLLGHVLYDPHHYGGHAANDLHDFLTGLSNDDLKIVHMGLHAGDLGRSPVALDPPFKRDDIVDVTIEGAPLGTGRVIDVTYSVGRDWLVMVALTTNDDVIVSGPVGHEGSATRFAAHPEPLPDNPTI